MKHKKERVVRKTKAWADIGSNRGIYVFEMGPVASRYPRLMHVYDRQITSDLIPVWIIPRPHTRKSNKK